MPANQQAIPADSSPSRLAELPTMVRASAPISIAAAVITSQLVMALTPRAFFSDPIALRIRHGRDFGHRP